MPMALNLQGRLPVLQLHLLHFTLWHCHQTTMTLHEEALNTLQVSNLS
jgi:hypothetical protein